VEPGRTAAARGSADHACLLFDRYLHHAPTRPQTRPHTHTTPLFVTTLVITLEGRGPPPMVVVWERGYGGRWAMREQGKGVDMGRGNIESIFAHAHTMTSRHTNVPGANLHPACMKYHTGEACMAHMWRSAYANPQKKNLMHPHVYMHKQQQVHLRKQKQVAVHIAQTCM